MRPIVPSAVLNDMSESSQSPWSCRICSQAFPTSQSLRADLQAHKVFQPSYFASRFGANIPQVLVRDLIAELERAVEHLQRQPSSSSLESSDASEDENDQSLALRTKNTSSNSNSKLRCPYTGCRKQRKCFFNKSSLNRHYTIRMGLFLYKTTRD